MQNSQTYANIHKRMQKSQRYAKITNVCKNHKGMQKSQTYAKITTVCKIHNGMQKSQMYAKITNYAKIANMHKLKAIPYYNFRDR